MFFMTPPEYGFTFEEALCAGSRCTAWREDGEFLYVTSITAVSLEPEVEYEVVHCVIPGHVPLKDCEPVDVEVRRFTELDRALGWLVMAHHVGYAAA